MDNANVQPMPWHIEEQVWEDGSVTVWVKAGNRPVAKFYTRHDAQFVLDMIAFKSAKEELEKTIVALEKERDHAIDQRDDLQGEVYLLKEELGNRK
jgi:hypothetical protein